MTGWNIGFPHASGGIVMLHLATRLLRVFNAEITDLSVADVAARLGVPEGEASSLIEAMHEVRLVEAGARPGRYRPGPMALDLAAAYRGSSALIAAATDAVSAASRQSGHTGFVTLLDGADATAAFTLPGTAPDRVQPRVSRMPANVSASGRTLLARLDDATIARLHPHFDRPATQALLARLDLLRDEGYEVSRSAAQPGVESVAVAVAAPAEGATVSLCIKYPVDGVAADRRAAIIADLLARATAIAAEMGDDAFAIAPLDEGPA